ncbi:MAG: VWA domain-containing protein, partial [bacterium]
MGSTRRILAVAQLVALLAVSCSNAELGHYEPNVTTAIQGVFCTENPQELVFPVKILFIIDTSGSMAFTDPEAQRAIAVGDVINRYNTNPGVSFGVIRFSGSSILLTDGFTKDPAELDDALIQLREADGVTNYRGAIGQATNLLSGDILGSELGERVRSRYVVIFFSDGLPYPPDTNRYEDIYEDIQRLMTLQDLDVGEIRFHTAFLNSPDTPFDVADEARQLLQNMATLGQGTFTNFANGEEINFLNIDYTSIQRVYTLLNVVVTNRNIRAGVDSLSVDSDRDGIPDEEETRNGTSPILRDSDADGCSDLVEGRLRFDPLTADCGCIPPITDEDRDGLDSCEELWLGTARDIYDSDKDGIPDGLEFVNGLNPLGDDRLDDLDFDGVRNGDEVQRHTNPEADDPTVRSRWAYSYSIVERGLDDASRRCYDFTISNVQFRPATAVPDQIQGTNLLQIYFAEVPWDDPEDYPVYRVAEVPIPVDNIPEVIRISPDDFEL